MKFAKEIEQDLVPEWRIKYLDYKGGKKRVKAVERAVNRMNRTPQSIARSNITPQHNSIYGSTSPYPSRKKGLPNPGLDIQHDESSQILRDSPAALGSNSNPELTEPFKVLKKTPPVTIPLNDKPSESSNSAANYGSFIPTPPINGSRRSFKLPDAALSTKSSSHPVRHLDQPSRPTIERSSISVSQTPYEIGPTTSPQRATFASLRRSTMNPQNVRPFLRRVFSVGTPLSKDESCRLDIDMIVIDQVKARKREFFNWMDNELDKIETFYKAKEDEAGARLDILHEQLHVMRYRRLEEVAAAKQAKEARGFDPDLLRLHGRSNGNSKTSDIEHLNSRDHPAVWLNPFERAIGGAKAKILGPHPGSNSEALKHMSYSPAMLSKSQPARNQPTDDNRDYVRRPHEHDVPYRTAKRKLKLALQEFYRGMELLKAYALLNRTAFRKINKKYDKAVNAQSPLRYMSEKVNDAWFVKSELLDKYIHQTEDLYASYFERGNRKVATGKLRSSMGRAADQSTSTFTNGVLTGTGAVFAIQGVIYGADLLHHQDPTIQVQTSYLLQIYGGYFLGLYLFSWFCLDCSIWTRNKINYKFVFEFDPRHNLDWRQLAQFPSFFLFLLGLFVWLNFSRYGAPEMYIYFPVILIFVTIVIIFFPAPVMFHRSRRWFVYSHWRLLLAGFYRVEFRDFFLGDMFCSLTYMTANIELFFCLYAHHWNNPPQCNSTHSRLLGFFSTLPGIWRALQCLRRYYGTRNAFPHLANCAKYGMTIMYYVTLSLYRINKTKNMLALFSTFAATNAIYCTVWDLFMDWSVLQPQAKKRFLRDVRGFKNQWYYYAAMILDPIFRFNWIFYSIYIQDLQHNTAVSFFVGFSEVTRRGIWTLFRVENEHCSNVARFKASRDVPLPYEVDDDSQESLNRQDTDASAHVPRPSPSLSRHEASASGAAEAQESGEGMRYRAPTRAFTTVLAEAHRQDFEKKRKPGAGDSDNRDNMIRDGDEDEDDDRSSDEDEEDEQDQQDVLDAEALIRERSGQTGGSRNR